MDRNVFEDNDTPFWSGINNNHPPFAFNNTSRGSLLQELYDHDIPPEHAVSHDVYMDQQHPFNAANDWSHASSRINHHHHHSQSQHQQQQQQQQHHDYSNIRRATFHYMRRDQEETAHQAQFAHHPSFLPESTGALLGGNN
jgi:GATA-binding protein, other eukaryote